MRTTLVMALALGGLTVSAKATTLHVPLQYPTIQAGLDAASPGDTVLVACGSYEEHEIEMKSGVCLRSETGKPDCVTISDYGPLIRCIDVDDQTRIEGFAIAAPNSWGMECVNAALTVANCHFHDNDWGGAMVCEDSSPTVIDCVFSENDNRFGAGGITASSSSVVVIDCTFLDNRSYFSHASDVYCEFGSVSLTGCTFTGYSVDAVVGGGMAQLTLRGCTFSHGVHGSSVLVAYASEAILENCILAFNSNGRAIECYDSSSTADLTCCNIYGNEFGNWVECIADQYGMAGNISEDPLFCDPEIRDFRLQSSSPCRPFSPPNPECGLIGAWRVGCGGTPTLPVRWGEIKALFLDME